MDIKINPVSGLKGTIKLPGDKSISHRALLFGALATGKTAVTNFLNAEDCMSTLRCLKMLGVKIDQRAADELNIEGVGFNGFKEPSDVLDAGNSGTTLRLLPGILAGQGFFSVLTGDSSLRKRPLKRITEPLSMMGARIWGREAANLAPIAIQGNPLKAVSYVTPIPSAQVKTTILLAGLLASGTTEVKEKFKSRDHTERMLRFLGANIEVDNTTYRIDGESELGGNRIDIPGDISSAAFFLVAALITPNSELLIKDVGVNPTRRGILSALEEMDSNIHQANLTAISEEPRADLLVRSSKLKACHISEEFIPAIIDELPILAIAATQSEGVTTVAGARELRVKESDRIEAICSGLQALGADIVEKPDGFIITGPTKLNGAVVDSFGDHRLAMAFAVAGLIADGTTTIKNAECIKISFPAFLEMLERISS